MNTKKSEKESQDWLGLGNDDEDSSKAGTAFFNHTFEGEKGKILLELQKTYKGDERFKLTDQFASKLDIKKLPRSIKPKASIKHEPMDREQKKISKIINEVVGEKKGLKRKMVDIGVYDPTLNMGTNLLVSSQKPVDEVSNTIKISKGKLLVGKKKKIEKPALPDTPKILEVNSIGWKGIIKGTESAFSIDSIGFGKKPTIVDDNNSKDDSQLATQIIGQQSSENNGAKSNDAITSSSVDKKKKKALQNTGKSKKHEIKPIIEEELEEHEETEEEKQKRLRIESKIAKKRERKQKKLKKMKKLIKVGDKELPTYYSQQFGVEKEKASEYLKYIKMIEEARLKQKRREPANK